MMFVTLRPCCSSSARTPERPSVLSMKAYKELSLDIGRSKLLHRVGAGGTETSHAGKMRASSGAGRRPGAHRSWVDAVSGRDFLNARKLRHAAADGSYEELLELIRRGADVTTADSKGRTALHFAASRGDANMVKLLISYGGSVNRRDCIGNTPLHLASCLLLQASCTHHVGVVTALLKAGTDVNARDLRGVTPLHLALSRLRILGDGGDKGAWHPSSSSSCRDAPLIRKKEMIQIVDMIREYLRRTESSKNETEELERLASQLSLSETSEQYDAVQGLLESFTSLSIQKRQDTS